MNVVNWLDVLLMVLGLLAVSPRLWMGFHCWRAGRPLPLGHGIRTVTALLLYLGLGILTAVGVDVALAEWDKAHHPNSDDWDAALAEILNAYRLRPIDPESFPKQEAPDFCLPTVDGDRSVRLSDFRGHKPVVLIFGSFG